MVGSVMYEGFSQPPRTRAQLERRRVAGLGLATLLYGVVIGWGLFAREEEPSVEVALEPDIKDIAPAEPPVEPAVEDVPPPPEHTPVKRVRTPKPRLRRRPPRERPTEAPDRSEREKVVEVGPGAGAGGTSERATGGSPPPPRPTPAPTRAPKPTLKPKKRRVRKIADRPAAAKPPVPYPNNAVPVYPAPMRAKGVTGVVVLKLKIDATGKVRGAQILKVRNNATDEDERDRFNKLMKKSVIAAVRTWRYEPATLEGEPIETGHMVTVPFRLST